MKEKSEGKVVRGKEWRRDRKDEGIGEGKGRGGERNGEGMMV